jgi:hypothetical protein
MRKNIYLRTDELLESIKALEMFCNAIKWVKKDPYYWKWAIMALHNSIQGFMVCALRSSNGLAVLTTKCAKAWMEAYENETTYPEEKLDDFVNLYKKIKSNLMIQNIDSKKYIPKGKEGWSIRKLNELRNDFIHFTPKSLSLEVSGLPKISKDILSIIDFLVNTSGNIYFYPSQQKFEKIFQEVLSQTKRSVDKLKWTYNS